MYLAQSRTAVGKRLMTYLHWFPQNHKALRSTRRTTVYTTITDAPRATSLEVASVAMGAFASGLAKSARASAVSSGCAISRID